MGDRRSDRLANAGRQMGKPVRKPKPKKEFDPKDMSPERKAEIAKAAEELWGTK